MSKYLNDEAVQDTMTRFRTYRRYVRTQPQTGWGRYGTENGHLQLTAMAGAGL
ncbi:hypothetical protein [Halorarius litoreus]|uniref:hypothetical protein n=1 Tax=Halorarius litoreus TaxID=2962676 RepID=UPI0020CE0604|nr:hypothetical protein [Halorarius litoreus]